MTKINLKIKGMHCESCEKLIKMELEDLKIIDCKLDYKTGNATITFNKSKVNLDQIKLAIKNAGYEVI